MSFENRVLDRAFRSPDDDAEEKGQAFAQGRCLAFFVVAYIASFQLKDSTIREGIVKELTTENENFAKNRNDLQDFNPFMFDRIGPNLKEAEEGYQKTLMGFKEILTA